MKIYGISGLGADERVFEYLNLKDKHLFLTFNIKPIFQGVSTETGITFPLMRTGC